MTREQTRAASSIPVCCPHCGSAVTHSKLLFSDSSSACNDDNIEANRSRPTIQLARTKTLAGRKSFLLGKLPKLIRWGTRGEKVSLQLNTYLDVNHLPLKRQPHCRDKREIFCYEARNEQAKPKQKRRRRKPFPQNLIFTLFFPIAFVELCYYFVIELMILASNNLRPDCQGKRDKSKRFSHIKSISFGFHALTDIFSFFLLAFSPLFDTCISATLLSSMAFIIFIYPMRNKFASETLFSVNDNFQEGFLEHVMLIFECHVGGDGSYALSGFN